MAPLRVLLFETHEKDRTAVCVPEGTTPLPFWKPISFNKIQSSQPAYSLDWAGTEMLSPNDPLHILRPDAAQMPAAAQIEITVRVKEHTLPQATLFLKTPPPLMPWHGAKNPNQAKKKYYMDPLTSRHTRR